MNCFCLVGVPRISFNRKGAWGTFPTSTTHLLNIFPVYTTTERRYLHFPCIIDDIIPVVKQDLILHDNH